MKNEMFAADARNAIEHFEVVDHVALPNYRRIEAEADTGSKYVMYAMPSDLRYGSADWLVVIRQPWQAVYEMTGGSYVDPFYFVEKLGDLSRKRQIERHHGGDVYALLECAALLIGVKYPNPIEL